MANASAVRQECGVGQGGYPQERPGFAVSLSGREDQVTALFSVGCPDQGSVSGKSCATDFQRVGKVKGSFGKPRRALNGAEMLRFKRKHMNVRHHR
jgi:hypothetical protein